MKPEPYFPPLPRELTDEERLYLKVSAAGGVHAFRLHGPTNFRIARGLAKIGLGEVNGNMFIATEAGVAAVAGETD